MIDRLNTILLKNFITQYLLSNAEFIYDDWNLISERKYTTDNNSTTTNYQSPVTNNYYWGLDISGTLAGAGGVGGLLQVSTDNGQWESDTFFPHYSLNGNIIAYTDRKDEVIAVYDYSAFGQLIASNAYLKDEFNFLFSTKYLDKETDLYYYGYRFYSPKLGRWMSREPLGEAESINLYDFCNNTPVNGYDVYGLFFKELVAAASTAVSSFAHSAASAIKMAALTAKEFPGAVADTFMSGEARDSLYKLCNPTTPFAKGCIGVFSGTVETVIGGSSLIGVPLAINGLTKIAIGLGNITQGLIGQSSIPTSLFSVLGTGFGGETGEQLGDIADMVGGLISGKFTAPITSLKVLNDASSVLSSTSTIASSSEKIQNELSINNKWQGSYGYYSSSSSTNSKVIATKSNQCPKNK